MNYIIYNHPINKHGKKTKIILGYEKMSLLNFIFKVHRRQLF